MLTRLSLGQKLAYYGALLLVAMFTLFPLYYMFTVSLKLSRDIYRSPSLIPLRPVLNNYVQLFADFDFLTNIRNSFLVAVRRPFSRLRSVVWRHIASCG